MERRQLNLLGAIAARNPDLFVPRARGDKRDTLSVRRDSRTVIVPRRQCHTGRIAKPPRYSRVLKARTDSQINIRVTDKIAERQPAAVARRRREGQAAHIHRYALGDATVDREAPESPARSIPSRPEHDFAAVCRPGSPRGTRFIERELPLSSAVCRNHEHLVGGFRELPRERNPFAVW